MSEPKEERRNALNRLLTMIRVFTISASYLRWMNKAYDQDPVGNHARIREGAQNWGKDLLKLLGGEVRLHGAPICQEPCLFVGNHMGFLDIIVVMSTINKSFVSKKEVQKWPIFGKGQAILDGVFVDRSDAQNRSKVAETIAKAIRDDKKSIVLFPEGTSSLWGKEWKRGAFVMAKIHKFKVQPFRIAYKPARKCAYYGKDNFLVSLWQLLGLKRFEVDVELFEPREITDSDRGTVETKKLVQDSFDLQMKSWGEVLIDA